MPLTVPLLSMRCVAELLISARRRHPASLFLGRWQFLLWWHVVRSGT